jgi:hypothetical protein
VGFGFKKKRFLEFSRTLDHAIIDKVNDLMAVNPERSKAPAHIQTTFPDTSFCPRQRSMTHIN